MPEILKLKAKFGIQPNEKLLTDGAIDIRTKKDDEQMLMRYRHKLESIKSKQEITRQRKFGAEYLITGNALTKKDNQLLTKFAGITLCTTHQLKKQTS
jgi:hypothetical protein